MASGLITHDVEIHPLEETIEKYYIDPIPENNIKGIFTSMCNRLGGIIKLRCDTFLKNKAILVEICQSKLRVRTEELWSYAKQRPLVMSAGVYPLLARISN